MIDDDDDLGANALMDKLDLRVRLLAAVGAAFAFSAMRHLPWALVCLGVAAGLLLVRRPPVPALLRHIATVNLFTFFMAATVPLTVPGEAVFGFGPWVWSREGMVLAVLIMVKSNAILWAFLALVAGAGPPRIGCALERMRVPAKLVFLFLFTSRYIHVIGDEWTRLHTAARLRGFVPRNSLHTYRTYAHLLGLTVLHGVDRARRVYEAMLLRGFDGTFHTVTEFRRTAADTVFLGCFALSLGGLLLCDRM